MLTRRPSTAHPSASGVRWSRWLASAESQVATTPGGEAFQVERELTPTPKCWKLAGKRQRYCNDPLRRNITTWKGHWVYILTCICAYASYSNQKITASNQFLAGSCFSGKSSRHLFRRLTNAVFPIKQWMELSLHVLIKSRSERLVGRDPLESQCTCWTRGAQAQKETFARHEAIANLLRKVKVESFRPRDSTHVSNGCKKYRNACADGLLR